VEGDSPVYTLDNGVDWFSTSRVVWDCSSNWVVNSI
jgi:hypothetical protein